MMTVRWAIAAGALMAAAAVQAQEQAPGPQPRVPTRVSAGTLSTLCEQDRVVCLGYILGAVDAIASSLVAAGRPQVFCIPAGVTNEQVSTAMQGYLRSHPEEGSSNAALVLLAGMMSAFPCP